MKAHNPIPWKMRLKAIGYDYLFTLAYLVLLLICTTLIYLFIFGKVPEFDLTTAQLIPTFTSILPLTIIFAIMDYRQGSFGKRKVGLKLFFQNHTIINSLIRNIIKFLPWQFGHMSTIRGLYTDFDFLSLVYYGISISLLISYFLMGFFRQDKRHLADLISGSQVQLP